MTDDAGSDVPADDPAEFDRLLELAVTLARRAGRAIIAMRVEAVVAATTKSSPTDPVTAADSAAERIVVDGILEVRPHDGIIGEEGANRSGRSNVRWFIDPIDGTTNYLYGIPAYSVSIAAEVDGTVSIGVVYNPVNDELFTAVAGRGSHLNGRPLSVSANTELGMSLIGTGFGYKRERRVVQARVLQTVLPEIRDIRRFGSAALDLCSVACGRLDGFYEAGLNVWDYAAGHLIVEEAGGACFRIPAAEQRSDWLVAATPDLIDPVRNLLEKAIANTV